VNFGSEGSGRDDFRREVRLRGRRRSIRDWLENGSSKGGERTFSAMANLTSGQAPIAALLRDQPNGGWTADPEHNKPSRDLGYTRYDNMAGRWAAPPKMPKS